MSDENTVASVDAVKTAVEESNTATTSALDSVSTSSDTVDALVAAVQSMSDVHYRLVCKLCDTIEGLSK